MSEKEGHRWMRHESGKIVKETARKYRKQLARYYKEEKEKASINHALGMLIESPTPHAFAVLLKSNGSMQYVQYGWTPKPDSEEKISDLEFILYAKKTMENPPKSPIWVGKAGGK